MADIYNSPNTSGNNPAGWIIGIVVLVLLAILLFMFFPNLFASMRGDTTEVNTEIPAAGTGDAMNPGTVINNTTINATSTFNTGTSTDE